MTSDKIRQALQPHLPGVILFLFALQPTLDVLSYWTDHLGLPNTLTLALRMLMLAFMVGLGFLLSRRKGSYFCMAAVLGIHALCHGAVIWGYGYLSPIGDLANLLRIYQLPLTTLVFITLLRQMELGLTHIRRGFALSFGLIIAVAVLSRITGTDPHTYANKGIGLLGWFYLPSAQSAILSIVIPVAMAWWMERKGLHPGWTVIICLTGFGMLWLFATRLAYAALLGTAGAFCVSFLILPKTRGERSVPAAGVMALFMILALVLLPVSPMEKNTELVAINAGLKQEDIHSLVEADDAAALEAGLTGEERVIASLASAYEKYLPGVTGRFGLERTARRYGYSTAVANLSNTRLQKLSYCRMLLEDMPACRFFGLELTQMTHNGEVYDVENDFHGIYYLCGYTGLALMAGFFLFFALRIARALILDFRKYFTLENAGYGIALICGIAHACFTAGVLRRPNTTFYLAVILAAVYVITDGAAKKGQGNES